MGSDGTDRGLTAGGSPDEIAGRLSGAYLGGQLPPDATTIDEVRS